MDFENSYEDVFDTDSLLSLLGEFEKEASMVNASRKDSNTNHDNSNVADSAKNSKKNDTDTLVEGIVSDMTNMPDVVEEKYTLKVISDFSPEVFSEFQLKEIELGIKHHVNVDVYADEWMTPKQMREIRYGLERGLDVSFYANRYIKHRAMKEIRIGLQDKLDVSSYARIIYSANDMRVKRKRLFEEQYDGSMHTLSYDYDDKETGLHIYVEPGLMEAGIVINKPLPAKFTKNDLKNLLNAYDITEGFLENEIPQNLANLPKGIKIPVMRGNKPYEGEDGWYEYKFAIEADSSPVINEDGSVDYSVEKDYTAIKRGDVIAIYHEATLGKPGTTVTGFKSECEKGKTLPPIECSDLMLARDKVTYLSKKDGFISYSNGQIRIMDNLSFAKDITVYDGRIAFDGTIQISGNVCENAEVCASGDIIVSGFVEGATLISGGNIIIRGGVNADHKGNVVAKGDITSAFFENANANAKGNIETGYILNSNISAGKMLTTKGKKSLICGGICKAGQGIKTGTIGSKANVRTVVEVSVAIENAEEYMKLKKEVQGLNVERDKLDKVMELMLKKMGSINARKDEVFIKIQNSVVQNKEKTEKLQKQIDVIDRMRAGISKLYVEVTNETHTGTCLVIGYNKLQVKETLKHAIFKCSGRSICNVYGSKGEINE